MGIEDLRRRDPNSSDLNTSYGSSRDGNANDRVPLVELSQLLQEMDAAGFGVPTRDREGEVIDWPTMTTPIDEQFDELGEPRHD